MLKTWNDFGAEFSWCSSRIKFNFTCTLTKFTLTSIYNKVKVTPEKKKTKQSKEIFFISTVTKLVTIGVKEVRFYRYRGKILSIPYYRNSYL
jgi:hypothetical protein